MKNERAIALLAVLACTILPGLTQTAPPSDVVNAIPMDGARIVLMGQIDLSNPKRPRLGYPGTGLLLRFQCTSLACGSAATKRPRL